jgi:hypothetical protein
MAALIRLPSRSGHERRVPRLVLWAIAALTPAALASCSRDTHNAPIAAAIPALEANRTTLVSITSRIAPGSTGNVVAHTAPGAQCTATIELNGTVVPAADASTHDADSLGFITWRLAIPSSAPAGLYDVRIDCTPGGLGGTSFRVQPGY